MSRGAGGAPEPAFDGLLIAVPGPGPPTKPSIAFEDEGAKEKEKKRRRRSSAGRASPPPEPTKEARISPPPSLSPYRRRRRSCCGVLCDSSSESGHWVDSNQFRVATSITIVLNTIYVSALEIKATGTWNPQLVWALLGIDCCFISIFMIELLLRFQAHGRQFFYDPWTYFDYALVFSNTFEVCAHALSLNNTVTTLGPMASVLRLARLARLLRVLQVLRLFRFVSDVHYLVMGLVSCFRSLLFAVLLLLALVYAAALIVTRYLGQPSMDETTQMYFGSLGRSMLTLFSLATLQEWPDLARHLLDTEPAGPTLAALVVAFVVVSNLALLNLITAVVLENVHKVSSQQAQECFEERSLRQLESLFLQMDMNGDGKLTLKELSVAVRDLASVQEELARLHIQDVDVKDIYNFLDADEDGSVTASEFIESMLCIKHGGPTARRMLSFQHEAKELMRAVHRAQEKMHKGMKTSIGELIKRGQEASPLAAAAAEAAAQQQGQQQEQAFAAAAEAAASAGSETAVRAMRRVAEQMREQLVSAVELSAQESQKRLEATFEMRLAAVEGRLQETLGRIAQPPSALEATAASSVLSATGAPTPQAAEAAAPAPEPPQDTEDLAASLMRNRSAMSPSAEVYLAGLQRQQHQALGYSPDSSGAITSPSERLLRTSERALEVLRSVDLTSSISSLAGGIHPFGTVVQQQHHQPRRGGGGGGGGGDGGGGHGGDGGHIDAALSVISSGPAGGHILSPGSSTRLAGTSAELFRHSPRQTIGAVGTEWQSARSPPAAAAGSAGASSEALLMSLLGPPEAPGNDSGDLDGGHAAGPGGLKAEASASNTRGAASAASSSRLIRLQRWLVSQGWAAAPFDKLVIRLDGLGIQLSAPEQDELKELLSSAGSRPT